MRTPSFSDTELVDALAEVIHPRTWADEALALCRQVEDVDSACQALSLKSGGAWFEGDHITARQLMEEALALSRRSSNIRARCYVLAGPIHLAVDLGDDVNRLTRR